MRAVRLKVHWVASVKGTMALLEDDLHATFFASGIDLDIAAGEDVATDPNVDLRRNYERVVSDFARDDPQCGHLVLAGQPPDLRLDVAGQLIDEARRGLVAAFLGSSYISGEGEIALLHTCVHEIGHMLNLAHMDVRNDYVSAMNSASSRGGGVSAAWMAAQTEMERSGEDPYLVVPSKPCKAYPFSYSARKLLNTQSDDWLMPWGGRFARPYDGLDDR